MVSVSKVPKNCWCIQIVATYQTTEQLLKYGRRRSIDRHVTITSLSLIISCEKHAQLNCDNVLRVAGWILGYLCCQRRLVVGHAQVVTL